MNQSKTMTFIRLGGMAGLLAAVLAILINFILISPPPPYNSSLKVITNYLEQEAEMIMLSASLRYLVWPLGLIFAVGLYQFVRGEEDGNHRLWAKVGLLGIVWMCSVGAVANSAEIIAAWRIETLEAQPQLLTGLWSTSIVLFTSAMVPWATAILSFSIAGRLSGVIPVWVAGLGLIMAISGMMTGIGMVSAVTGGWAEIPSFVAFILVNIWVLAVSVLMLRK